MAKTHDRIRKSSKHNQPMAKTHDRIRTSCLPPFQLDHEPLIFMHIFNCPICYHSNIRQQFYIITHSNIHMELGEYPKKNHAIHENKENNEFKQHFLAGLSSHQVVFGKNLENRHEAHEQPDESSMPLGGFWKILET